MNTKNITLSGNEKIALISNMATMLAAGIPILEAVESIHEDSKGNVKKILETLRDDLTQGKRIAFSFARFPKTFDKVTINIIKASEEAGALDVALKDLKDNIRKEMEFSDKIRGALIYPLVILGVFAGVFILILTFVVPKISTVFLRLKVELPLPTQIMIALSNFVLTYTIPAIIGTVALSVGMYFFWKTNKRMLLTLLTSLPLVSQLAREIDLTRFSHSLYLLLNAGIPITSALELTQDVVVKKEVTRAITHAKEVILAGKNLSEGFRDQKKVIPSIMIKITEAGERSGSLDKSMQDVSEFMDYEVSKTLKTVTTLMEPLMLVFVGVLIGGMMMAIIAPIYGLIGQVGNR
jgi:type IV pilus assembly protein PilC